MNPSRNEFRIFFNEPLSAVQLYQLSQTLIKGNYLNILEVTDLSMDPRNCDGIIISEGAEPIADYLEIMKQFPFIKGILSACDNPQYQSGIKIHRAEAVGKRNCFLIECF